MKKLILINVFLLTLLLLYAPSLIASPALTFNPTGGAHEMTINNTVGWKFNVLSPISVTGLGWWDETGTGIPLAHEVGIWNPSGTLLADVIVPAGTVAPLDGQFRTVAITPISLGVAEGYLVGGREYSNETERLASGVEGELGIGTVPQIAFVNATWTSDTFGFNRPVYNFWDHDGLFGPSFSVDSAAVPEPATMLLLGSGLIGLAGYGRRKFFKK